jgi:hypothetical protein
MSGDAPAADLRIKSELEELILGGSSLSTLPTITNTTFIKNSLINFLERI